MTDDLIPINFYKVMQSRAYTVIILGTEQKKFAIYTQSGVGQAIQSFLTEDPTPRPLTHDLIQSIFKGFEIKPIQVVINRIEDTVYFARIYLEQKVDEKKTILEIDARPSDCIILALSQPSPLPVFCRKEVFEQAVAIED